jgi:TonB family protein
MDGFGNLSEEATMLYAEGKLNEADKATIDAIADADEITRDALDGFVAMQQGRRLAVSELKATLAERTGTAIISTSSASNFPFFRIAAGLALLMALGLGTYFASKYINEHQMASTDTLEVEVPIMEPALAPVVEEQIAEIVAVDTAAISQELLSVEDAPQPAILTTATPAKPEPKIVTASEKAQLAKAKAALADAEKKPAVADATPKSEKIVLDMAGAAAPSERDDDEIKVVVQSAAVQETTDSKKKGKAKKEEPARAESASRNAAMREASSEIAESQSAKVQKESVAFDLVESPPRFPGGDLEMFRFINRNKNYPEVLKNDGVSGNVYVNFTVEKDGKITGIEVTKGVNAVLDEDAKRVLRAMPKWNPGEQGGEPVRTSKTLVIKYE